MVKRIFIITMMVVLSSTNVSGAHYYQSLCSAISNVGQSIENINNVPVIGKLTNVLPMAILAASLKECPMQTMMVLAVLSGYIMSQNSAVQEMMEKYEFLSNVPWINRNNKSNQQNYIDENIFVFDGDDSDDSDDDDSLEDDLLDEEIANEKKPKNHAQQLLL